MSPAARKKKAARKGAAKKTRPVAKQAATKRAAAKSRGPAQKTAARKAANKSSKSAAKSKKTAASKKSAQSAAAKTPLRSPAPNREAHTTSPRRATPPSPAKPRAQVAPSRGADPHAKAANRRDGARRHDGAGSNLARQHFRELLEAKQARVRQGPSYPRANAHTGQHGLAPVPLPAHVAAPIESPPPDPVADTEPEHARGNQGMRDQK